MLLCNINKNADKSSKLIGLHRKSKIHILHQVVLQVQVAG